MVFLTSRQQIAVKIEVTEGTDAVPADVDVIAPIYDPEWEPTIEMGAREVVRNSISPAAAIAGERSAVIRFATELKGSGTAGTPPPNLDAPFRGSRMAVTNVIATSDTYAPASENNESVTVELREMHRDGTAKIKKIVGAKGTFTIEAVKGQPVMVRFEFTGKYVEPTEGTAFTDAAISPNPEPFLNAGFSYDGVSNVIQNLSVDMANEIVLRNDANDATGNTMAVIANSTPVGNIDPEQVKNATDNFFADWVANNEGSLDFVLGAGAGNITTFNAPKAQIMNISEADRDTIRTEGIDLQLNGSAAIGDDEFTIVFT